MHAWLFGNRSFIERERVCVCVEVFNLGSEKEEMDGRTLTTSLNTT
jgi:hypothetical protein